MSPPVWSSPVQLPLEIRFPDSATFDSFFAGSNAPVVDALQSLDGGAGGSLMFLHGAGKSGKSHLLQALCRSVSDHGGRAVYLPLSELVDEPVELLDGLDTLPLLCLDDVNAVAGHRNWAVALVALFDRVRAAGASLVCASSIAIDGISDIPEDLRSRLRWGARYSLAPLDDEQRCGLLQLRARQRGVEMPDDAARFLVSRYPRDMQNLVDAVDRIDRASLQAQRRVTVPFVKQVLSL